MSELLVRPDSNLAENRESRLEQQLIADFLRSKGYRKSDLQKLANTQRRILMQQACMYASVRLANIEAKSKFSKAIKYP